MERKKNNIAKLNLKKGDIVKVITGGEAKGKQGRILRIFVAERRAIVEGINMSSKHTKPNTKYPQGGIIKKETSIHLSNLMLIDPSTGNPTRVGRKLDENGKLVRYSKKSGTIIK